ncbi:hypothetical protein BGZ73_008059 [Actinomortierella ambigua]|nr:hypothetical protein BGZ73_008059 [Actinomortierella ambigua]
MASSAERNYVLTSVGPGRRSSLHASLQPQAQQQQQHDQTGSASSSGSVGSAPGAGVADTHGFPPPSSLQAQTNTPHSHSQQHYPHPHHEHPGPYPPTSTAPAAPAAPAATQHDLPHKLPAYHAPPPPQQHAFQQHQHLPPHPSPAQHPYPTAAPQYTYPPSPASPTLSPAQQQQQHQQHYGRAAQPPPQQPLTGIYSPTNTHHPHHPQLAAPPPASAQHPHESYASHHASAVPHHGHDLPPSQALAKGAAVSDPHTAPFKRDGSPRMAPSTVPAVRRSGSTEWLGDYPSAACSYAENQHPTQSYAPRPPAPQQQSLHPQQQQQQQSQHAPPYERFHHQHTSSNGAAEAVASSGKGSRAYPPPIQTRWPKPTARQQQMHGFHDHHALSPAVVEPNDCPPLSYQGSSGYSLSTMSTESSRFSPTTPRSTPHYLSEVARPPYLTESPIDFTMSPQGYPPPATAVYPRSAYPPAKHFAGFHYQAIAQPPLSSAGTHAPTYHPHQPLQAQAQHPQHHPQHYRHHRLAQHQQSLQRGYRYDEDDMEQCSEQDDALAREEKERYEQSIKRDEEDEEDDTDKLGPLAGDALGGVEEDAGESSKKSRSKQHSRSASTTTATTSSKRKLEKLKSSGGGGGGGEDGEDTGSSTAVQFLQSPVSSGTSSRKPSLTNSDDKPARGAAKAKSSPAQKRGPRPASVRTPLDDLYDGDEHTGNHTATHANGQTGRGLRHYSQRVCEYVREKGITTYIKLVNELAGQGGDSEDAPPTAAQEGNGQENIRRRVYDALNVLEAMGIIKMDKNEMEKKEIQWIGIAESMVVHDVTRSAQGRSPSAVDEPDIESEEPGVDDMELERLEKETAALTLSNTILRAQLQDQITRHVQLVNLVERNKKREARDAEAKEERRRRHEEKRKRRKEREAKKRAEMKEVVILRPDRIADRQLEEFSQAESDRPQEEEGEEATRISLDRRRKHRHHRHHRRSSPRANSEIAMAMDEDGDGHDAEGMVQGDEGVEGDVDHEDENEEMAKELRRARRREKREKRERREEKRLAKKQLAEQQQLQQQALQANPYHPHHHPNFVQQEQFHHAHHYQRRAAEESEEEQRIQLPMFVIKMPLYGCQSSDSEASIGVIRRVREEQRPRKSGKNKRQCGGEETTMVQIQIPSQDDLHVVSDTEVLGEMGLNKISHQSLRRMLPKELMDNVQYATSQAQLNGGNNSSSNSVSGADGSDEVLEAGHPHHPHHHHLYQHHGLASRQRSAGVDEDEEEEEDVEDDEEGLPSGTVWVRKGFERQVVLPRDSGYTSAVSGFDLSSSLDG